MERPAPRDLALKGAAVEEWIDVHFFRPLGLRVAVALLPTRVTPNLVTLFSVVVGVAGAHLFFYDGLWINVAGIALVIAADVLDSADGQLARLSGRTSRWGRVLDGYADTVRWTVLYLHLFARAVRHGAGADDLVVAMLGALSHMLGAATIDFAYGAYTIAAEGKGLVDLPEDFGAFELPRAWWGAPARSYYRDYARRQANLLPRTAALLRALRTAGAAERATIAALYAERQAPTMKLCALLGQNAHLALLAVAALSGRPMLFFWGSIVLGFPLLALVIGVHERRARPLLRALSRAQRAATGRSAASSASDVPAGRTADTGGGSLRAGDTESAPGKIE